MPKSCALQTTPLGRILSEAINSCPTQQNPLHPDDIGIRALLISRHGEIHCDDKDIF